jgi:hypothetical protein
MSLSSHSSLSGKFKATQVLYLRVRPGVCEVATGVVANIRLS